MKINNVYCLFEQSGTFKKAFLKHGIHAEDYDILNDFGQTDHIVDLFAEIRGGYNGEPSIFDDITKNDLIIAFFPCIRFENQILLHLRGQSFGQKNWSLKKKMENCMQIQREITEMYELVNMLFIICIDKGLRLIVENPYSEEHYLRRYWCYEPTLIDHDRRDRGDYYKKPTQYWFLNCKPSFNFIFEVLNYNAVDCKDPIRTMKKEHYEQMGAKNCKVARSMIHPDYADRFIREYVLEENQ